MENVLKKIESLLFFLLILFLPTQFGKHFWPDFSIVAGIRIDYLSPTIYATDVLIGLLFLAWCFLEVIKGYKVKNPVWFRGKGFILLHKPFLLFCIYLLITIALSQHLANGFYALGKFLEFSFVGWYVCRAVKKTSHLASIVTAFSWAVLLQSSLAIAQFVKQGSLGGLCYFFGERLFTPTTPGIANASIGSELILRPYGTFSHPNVLAGYLLCSMVLIFFCQRVFGPSKLVGRFVSKLWSLALLLGTAGLLLTMSRVAIVLWLCMLLLLFVQQIRCLLREQRKRWVMGLFFAMSLVLLGLSQSPFGLRLLHSSTTEESVVQRMTLLDASVKLFAAHPLFGVGLGNFLPSLPLVQDPLSASGYFQPVHNIFVLVLVETGFIGCCFFLWFLLKTYRQLFLSLQKSTFVSPTLPITFVILLTTLLILGSFDHYFLTLQQGQLLFAVVLGLCWARFRD